MSAARVHWAVMGTLLALSVGTSSASVVARRADVTIRESDVSTSEPSVDVAVGIGAGLFNKIFNDVVPIIDLLNLQFPVPGINDTHFEFSSFNLSDIQLTSLQASFSQSPATLTLALAGLSLTIPPVEFLVRDTVLGIPISCQGSFFGNASQTNIDLSGALATSADGVLSLTSVTPNVSFGGLFVNHTIDGSVCQSLVGIIRDFIGSLNKLIEKLIKEDLPSKLAGIVEKEGNKELAKLPFKFVSQPQAYNDTLSVDADVTDRIESPMPPTHSHGKLPRSRRFTHTNVFVDRDLAVSVNTESFNNLLIIETNKGKFDVNKMLRDTTAKLNNTIPIAYKLCPNCPLAIDFFVQRQLPPTVLFHDDSITLNITNAIFGLNADNNATHKIVKLVDAYLNLSLALVNFSVVPNGTESVIHFDLQLNDFGMSTEHSIIGNLIDFKKYGEILEDIMWAWLLPEFNAKFAGVPIDLDKDGIGLGDWLLDINSDALTLGMNLLLPKI